MKIKLFKNFNKRNNSTKQPNDSTGEDREVKLKGETDILNPIFQISNVDFTVNYVKWMDRYYHVSSIIADSQNLYTITCTIDVLASWKEYIKRTTAQVIFSSSMYDLSILDNRMVSTGEYTRKSITTPFIGATANTNTSPTGTFAINVLRENSQWTTGSSTTYFLTYSQMITFAKELVDPSAWESFLQFFNNPMDGIIECYYIPVNVGEFITLSADSKVQIGSYEFPNATGKMPLASTLALKSKTAQIEIPWEYDDYRRLQPYNELSLFVPFCGAKPISPELVYNIDMLFIDYGVDIMTGNVQAIVYNKDEVLEEFSGNCKVSIPIAQVQSKVDNIIGATGSAITAVAGFASGNVALGATGVLAGISAVITPSNVKTMGGLGGSALGATLGNETMRWQQFRLSSTARKTADNPEGIRATMGNALNKVVSLSGLSGFVQTSGFSLDAPALKSEKELVNTQLDSGVYLE